MLARIDLGVQDPTFGNTFEISQCNVSTDLTVVVTGPGCYRYLRINDTHNGFRVMHDKLALKESSKPQTIISDVYTCHAWDQASKLVVCTAEGEIMVCDYDGFV